MPLQPNEAELGVWCMRQRQHLKGTKRNNQPPLTMEQQAALAAIPGWSWDDDDRWEQRAAAAEGLCAAARAHATPEGLT